MVYQTSQTLVERNYINLKLQTISILIWTGVVFMSRFHSLGYKFTKKKKWHTLFSMVFSLILLNADVKMQYKRQMVELVHVMWFMFISH